MSAPLMELLQQVLLKIREEGFNPVFFGCDKDLAEIAAIKVVFPDARIQLCYWHVLRAALEVEVVCSHQRPPVQSTGG